MWSCTGDGGGRPMARMGGTAEARTRERRRAPPGGVGKRTGGDTAAAEGYPDGETVTMRLRTGVTLLKTSSPAPATVKRPVAQGCGERHATTAARRGSGSGWHAGATRSASTGSTRCTTCPPDQVRTATSGCTKARCQPPRSERANAARLGDSLIGACRGECWRRLPSVWNGHRHPG